MHFYNDDTTFVQQSCCRRVPVSKYQNASIPDFIRARDAGGAGDSWSYKMYKAAVKSLPVKQQSVKYSLDALPVT